MWSLHVVQVPMLVRDKRNGKVQKADIHQNYKRHIPEFAAVAENSDHALLCLASNLVTVASQAGWQSDKILSYNDFLKFNIQMPVSVFLFLCCN